MATRDHLWDAALDLLRSLPHASGASATADLLELVRPRWEPLVVARTSMSDVLFVRPQDEFPWPLTVRLRRADGDSFEFQLVRDGHLVTGDRATDDSAPAVLDAFLMQLTDT